MKPAQLRTIIKATLDFMGPSYGGVAAEELLLGTAAQESNCGEFVCQVGGGPALGVWQMEPATHDDIWTNFLSYRADLTVLVRHFVVDAFPKSQQLVGNLYYACAMARIQYLRSPLALPRAGDLQGQAEIYKAVFNTANGAATADQYIRNAKGALT